MICTVDECTNQAKVRGWCYKHYHRWQRNGSVDRSPVASVEQKREADRARSRAYRNANLERRRAYDRAYGAANRERQAVRSKAWYVANRERNQATVKAWREANPDRNRALVLKWKAENPERVRALALTGSIKRRARIADVFVESVDPAVVFDRAGGVCQICDEPIGDMKWHIDHIVPIVRGGEHSYANVQLAHARCNMVKGTKLSA